MHALFNFEQTSTLHAHIRDCTLIFFSKFLKHFRQILRPNLEKIWQKLVLFSGKFCSFGSFSLFVMLIYKSGKNCGKMWKELPCALFCILSKNPSCTLIQFVSKFNLARSFGPACLFGTLEYIHCLKL